VRVGTEREYAMRCMVTLSREREWGEGKPLSRSKIAKAQNLPSDYVEIILLKLRRAGLVRSVRGVQGGYLLARHPSEISALDIFQVFTPQVFSACATCKKPGAKRCRNLCTFWAELGEDIVGSLRRTTLADLHGGKS
jgi:Rrf2 family protein